MADLGSEGCWTNGSPWVATEGAAILYIYITDRHRTPLCLNVDHDSCYVHLNSSRPVCPISLPDLHPSPPDAPRYGARSPRLRSRTPQCVVPSELKHTTVCGPLACARAFTPAAHAPLLTHCSCAAAHTLPLMRRCSRAAHAPLLMRCGRPVASVGRPGWGLGMDPRPHCDGRRSPPNEPPVSGHRRRRKRPHVNGEICRPGAPRCAHTAVWAVGVVEGTQAQWEASRGCRPAGLGPWHGPPPSL